VIDKVFLILGISRLFCPGVFLSSAVLLLVSCASADAPEPALETELSLNIRTSIIEGDLDSFVRLVDSDEVANMTIYGKPMAAMVARHRRIEMFRYLLDHGLNIEATGKLGYPLSFHVMTSKYDEFLELLLDHGLDPNTTWKNGSTLTRMAYVQNRDRALSLLLDRGANPNVLSPFATLLTEAVKSNNETMVGVLLLHHADPHAKQRFSEKTACDIALEKRDQSPNIWKLMETPCD